MKRLFLFCLTVLFFSLAQAQEKPGTLSVIPHVGVSVANLTDFNWTEGMRLVDHFGSISSNYKPGFTGGVQMEYQATEVFSASAALLYSMQGTKYPDFMVDNEDGTAEGVANLRMDLHYLNVPVMLNAYVLPGLALKTGLQIAFLLDGRLKQESTPVTIDEEGAKTYGETEDKETKWNDLKSFDISIPIGLSYEFENVILDARYNLGITKIHSDYDWRNSFFTFTVGYRFVVN
ncbi:MAG: PorT family protein [Prevotella sp.]|nr:PorT family protein [Prevotella sp.]